MNARAGAASRPTILLAVLAAIALSMLYLIRPVAATQPGPHKVTICHRTASETNPYVRITVDEASVNGNDNRKGDHLLEHTGPVWPDRAGDPAKWGDIIPPFYADGVTLTGYPGLNWDAGKAIFDNSCNFAGETVTVRVPTLVVDKATPTDVVHFVFNLNGSLQSVTPAQVTWTLTYTLTNGPVTNAVITDPLPASLNFVSASHGGTFAAGVITWNLGRLTTGGTVSFVTTVPNAQTGSILNVATIDSTETAPDTGQDSITVTSQQLAAATAVVVSIATPTPKPVQAVAAATGTPAQVLSDAALSQSGTSPIPTVGFALILLASLLMLARANVKPKVTTVRNRS